MINTDGIHIRTSDYMQAGGFVINRDTEFGSFQVNIHEAFSGDDVTQQFKEEKYLTSDAKKKVSEGALPGKLWRCVTVGRFSHAVLTDS